MNGKIFKGFIYFLKYTWKNQRNAIWVSITREIFIQFKSVIFLLFPKIIIDTIIANIETKTIYPILYIIVSFITITLILNLLENTFTYFTEIQFKKLENKTELFFSEQSIKLNYHFVDSKEFLDMREMAQKYMYTNGRFGGIYFLFLRLIGYIFNFTVIITAISTLNIFIIVCLLFFIWTNNIVKSKENKVMFEFQVKNSKLNRQFFAYQNILLSPDWLKEIRVNNYTKKVRENRNFVANTLVSDIKKGSRFLILTSGFLMNIPSFLENILKYIYLGYKVLTGNITIGSFSLYLQAIESFSSTLNNFSKLILQLKNSDLYYEEFDKFIKLNNKEEKELKKIDSINTIEFKNVYFKYPNAENYTLENINLKINKGEKLLIVGENGAGKTTFIKLLIKLYNVTEGEILINGININNIDNESYMNVLSVVFQDFKLFSYSIKDNVTLFNNNISDEEVIEVLEKSGLKKNLYKFEKGIHTTLYKEFDDNGIRLSGGEAQKLSIAKALFKNGSMVILDEPTAALDPRSEYEIYIKFNELVKNKTAIYISHRLSSAKICDNIVVFEKGKIVEYGTHNELIEKNGIYSEFYSKQAQYYNEEIKMKVGEENV